MPLTMFDSVNVREIPANAQAVAGYVNGRWPTYAAVVRGWPHAHHLSIAVSTSANADCLDVEPGDATNTVAAGWIKRQQARGVKRPVVYTSVSNARALLDTLAKVGIGRTQIRLWTAHYTHVPHRCGPGCGFGMNTTADATQYTNKAQGKNLDASLVSDMFFGPPPKPQPKPAPKPAPKPVPPPAPKPQPKPAPVADRYLQITDKDGTQTWDAYSKAGRFKRGMQFASGKFKGVEVVNEMPKT